MDKTYHFPWMDSPRSEPQDHGKKPKYMKPEEFISVEEAQLMRLKWEDPDGNVHDLPATLMRRANTSYLGHESSLFETPWPYEDRWTANDPHFRRIPAKKHLTKAVMKEVVRLAQIENPGRCFSRRSWVDGWCHRTRVPGAPTCIMHTSPTELERVKAERARQQELIAAAKYNTRKTVRGSQRHA